MSKYYLYAVILDGCPFSMNALKLLNTYPKINKSITIINQDEKNKYKTEQINTFPQIYLKKYDSKGSLLIGGYTELTNMFNTFHYKYNINDVNDFIKKNNLWSRKALLRFIELINSK
jgi:hypothetical protein